MGLTNMGRWQLYMKDIESPDIFIEWGFYHLISSALQRRVWLYSDADTKLPSSFSLFPNLYIVLVGKPSTGKGRVIVQTSNIIKNKKLEWPLPSGELRPLIPFSPDKLTLEALMEHIGEHAKSISRKTEKGTQNYGYSPCSFNIEELEVLFAQNTNDMVSAICSMYDSQNIHYKTKHQGENNLKNICVSMIAGTTPDSIRDLMTNKVIKKGMTSRTIMIYGDAPRFYRQFPGLTHEQMVALDELLKYIKELTFLFGEIRLSPEASAYHKRLYESGIIQKERRNKDPRLDDYYGRKNIHWLKLMTVMHYSEQIVTHEIPVGIVDRAWEALTRAENRMHECYQTSGRNLLHESNIQIIRYLQEKGRTSSRKLQWIFNKDLNKQQLEECLEVLTTTGRIRQSNGEYIAINNEEDNESRTTTEQSAATTTATSEGVGDSNECGPTDTIDLNTGNSTCSVS